MLELNKVYCMDVLEALDLIEDESINLAIVDPPYYKIMLVDHTGEKYEWDDQWKSLKEYQEWIFKIGIGLKRILTSNGSLYFFADDKICAYVQVILDRLFNLENNIVWYKPNNVAIKCWSGYRCFLSCD